MPNVWAVTATPVATASTASDSATVSLTSLSPTIALPKASVTITGSVHNSAKVSITSPVVRAFIGTNR